MRKRLILYLFLFVGAIAYGQNRVEFTYDNAGNRTSRQIVPLNKSAKLSENIAIAEGTISNKTIRLYPNPTYGLLTMDISDLQADEKVTLQVSDMAGHILLKEVQATSIFKIDITAAPKGFYILSATIGSERKEWKIVKE